MKMKLSLTERTIIQKTYKISYKTSYFQEERIIKLGHLDRIPGAVKDNSGPYEPELIFRKRIGRTLYFSEIYKIPSDNESIMLYDGRKGDRYIAILRHFSGTSASYPFVYDVFFEDDILKGWLFCMGQYLMK